MKKLVSKVLFALITTALVISSAQAATVVEKDGFKYELKGDLQIQLRQEQGIDEDLEVEYDDLEIKNAISYDLANGLTAFGELDYGFKKAAEGSQDSSNLEEAFVGLGYQEFSVLMGKTDSAADDFGIYGGLESYGTDDAFHETDGDDLIKVEAGFDIVNVIAAYELESDDEYSSFFDIIVNAEVAGAELAVAYQNADNTADNVVTYGISLAYDAEVVWVGADYSVEDDNDTETTVWNIAAEVPVAEMTTIGAGYNYTNDDDEEVSAYYANVQHKLHKNVKVFVELGDNDKDNVDMGYLAGLQVKF
jgi:predicted porin